VPDLCHDTLPVPDLYLPRSRHKELVGTGKTIAIIDFWVRSSVVEHSLVRGEHIDDARSMRGPARM